MKNRLFSHPRKRRNHSNKTRRTGRKLGRVENLETRRLLTATGFATELPPMESVDTAQVAQSQSNSISGDRSLRIVNGVETSGFKAVGIVDGGCSGTLIAPNAVLTAAHCISGDGSGMDFEVDGKSYSVKEAVIHPEYGSRDVDLAVLILNEDVTGVDPMEISRTSPQVGQMLTLVGFGGTGTAQGGHNGDFGVKHVGQTPIDGFDSTHITWNYDHASEANTAPGDSGGPAFVDVNGKQVIAGVTSGGSQENAGLGDESYDVRVDTFASWIDSVVSGNPESGDPVDPVDNGEGGDNGDDGVDDGGEEVDVDDDFGRGDAEQLALEELAEFDTDGDGSLSPAELKAEMESYGYTPSEAQDEADLLISDFDADRNGLLNLSELTESWGGETIDLGEDDVDESDDFDEVDEMDEVDEGEDVDECVDDFHEGDGEAGEQDDYEDDYEDGVDEVDESDPMDDDFEDEQDEMVDEVDELGDLDDWFDEGDGEEVGAFGDFEDLDGSYEDECDVNRDGFTTPMDALMVVNYLNTNRNATETDHLDVNRDGTISPMDALRIVNQINGGVTRSAAVQGSAAMNDIGNSGTVDEEGDRVDLVFANYANDSVL